MFVSLVEPKKSGIIILLLVCKALLNYGTVAIHHGKSRWHRGCTIIFMGLSLKVR